MRIGINTDQAGNVCLDNSKADSNTRSQGDLTS